LGLLRSASGLTQSISLVLLVMWGRSAGIVADLGFRYAAARRHTRTFVREAAIPLRDGNLVEAMAIAEGHKQSHVARVALSGLDYFKHYRGASTTAVTLEFVERGLKRCAARIHRELKQGTSALATIGATAPFVGLIGTTFGIVNAFKGICMQKDAAIAAINGGLAEALLSTALGLLVAVPTTWMYNHFVAQVELLDIEMKNTSLEMVTLFAARMARQPSTSPESG